MRVDDAIVAYLEPPQRAALAAELGLDWAALPGEGDSRRAAALVTAAIRRGQWAALSAALAALSPAVAWADLPTPLSTLHALHTDLCRRLSLDGLRTLCFQLGIDFDDLPGDSKAGRARELVLWLERAGRVGELSWAATRRVTPKAGPGANPWRKLLKMGRKLPNWRRPSRNSGKLRYTMPLLALLVAALLIAADGRTLPAANYSMTPISAVVNQADIPVTTPTPSPTWVSWTWGNSLPTATATPTSITAAPPAEGQSTAAADTPIAYVIVGPRGANLRQGPGAAYAVVATLRAGAQLTVRAVSPTGEWYQVRLPGQGSPWIDAAHAILGGGAGGLPVATAAQPTAPATMTAKPAPPSGRPVIPGDSPTGPAVTATNRPLPPTPTRTPAAPPTPWPSPTVPPP